MGEYNLVNENQYLMTQEQLAHECEALQPVIEALKADGRLRHIMVFAPEIRPWGQEALILLGTWDQLFQHTSLLPPETLTEHIDSSYKAIARKAGLEYEADAVFTPNTEHPQASILQFPRMTSADRSVRVICYPDWMVATTALRDHWPAGGPSIPGAEPHRPASFDPQVHYYSPDIYSYNPNLGDTKRLEEQATMHEIFLAHLMNDHDGEYWDGPRNA